MSTNQRRRSYHRYFARSCRAGLASSQPKNSQAALESVLKWVERWKSDQIWKKYELEPAKVQIEPEKAISNEKDWKTVISIDNSTLIGRKVALLKRNSSTPKLK